MPNKHWGYASLILATVFWGGNYVLGKLLSETLSPISLTYLRWFPAFCILALLFFRPAWQALSQLTWRALWVLWALGGLGIVAFPATLYQGLQMTSALNASLYLAVVPVLVLWLNRILFGEKISLRILIGAIISFVGVLWLLSQGDFSRLVHFHINQGDIWAVLSAMSWALYCAIIRLRPANVPNAAFLTLLVGLAIGSLTPFFLFDYVMGQSAKMMALSSLQWSGIAYLVIGPSILSYAFWNYGMALVGSAKGAVMTNFTPLFAALFSILVLNEQVSLFHWISAGLISLGVIICSYAKKME